MQAFPPPAWVPALWPVALTGKFLGDPLPSHAKDLRELTRAIWCDRVTGTGPHLHHKEEDWSQCSQVGVLGAQH